MDFFSTLALGFDTAILPYNLLACAFGVTLGTFIGVLPGIGPLAAISILLPVTFKLDPIPALMMLSGIYYGAAYGGSTASILLNLPGTAANSVTCLDGYPMAKAGRGGVALFLTTIASFVGGSFAILLMALFSPPLAEFALQFGSPEYFSLMVLGLIAAAALSSGSMLKGLAMVVVGILIGLIGMDHITGTLRYNFDRMELYDGVSIVIVAMGLFGVSEILNNMAVTRRREVFANVDTRWRAMVPTKTDMNSSWKPIGRGSVIGAIAGILPGAGGIIAAFISYAVEKRIAKDPSRFGKGAVEGLASAEASNNSAAQAAFIPTMTLGIPGNSTMAVMLGALMIHGITPGPSVVVQQPELFWGLIASFWIGNFLLLILNLPLIGLWVRILTIPYRFLSPAILFFICFGAYSVGQRPFDVFLLLAFGVLGYLMKRLDYPAAPLLLGFILGPMMESHFRRTMIVAQGDFMYFLNKPISASFLAASCLFIAYSVFVSMKKRTLASVES